MSEAPVTEERNGSALVVTLANGKANAISHAVLEALNGALDTVEHASAAGDDGPRALVISGTPGMLSGGFDLNVMRAGPLDAGRLVTEGGAFITRCYASPVPVVVACTGHAVAAGALLLLGADWRVGAEGAFRIGLIETEIGMVLPRWAVELGAERLSVPHRQEATVGARMYDPAGARAAGFLDVVVEPDAVLATACAEAERLGAFPAAAYAGQVKMNRGERIARLEEAVAGDRGRLFDVPG